MNTIKMADTKLAEGEIEAAVNVLRSGMLRQGNQCEAFENDFSIKTGSKHSLTCANGTAALHLAYMAFLKPGDEVLVPSFTFIATGSMVTMAGGRPVFCDVCPDTFLVDLEDAKRKISSKTKAIAPVHLFGNPCDIEAIKGFAEENGLKIVWDAAQAHGAEYKGMDVGGFGDLVCYSFYPTKNMFVGEGGMITTNNPDYDFKIRYMRSHGQTRKYTHTLLGLNYRMTDVEAAIGRKQLNRLDEMLEIRRRNAAYFNDSFKDIEAIKPQTTTPGGVHAWHQYCVLIDSEKAGGDRDALSIFLKDRGISTGVHYPRGLHQQPIFKELYGVMNLPVTETLTERILALPVHHSLAQKDLERIVEGVRDFFKKNKP